ncbi:MAG: VapC toxin family PIN domain ribonuclease [Ornithinimicrobium sp.]
MLVDASIWIDHFRVGDPTLVGLIDDGHVLAHPWVIGESALGYLAQRVEILGLLENLPQATVATNDEVLTLIEGKHLSGRGIGHVHTHLLVATLLTPQAQLWTRDKRLAATAVDHGLASNRGT